MNNVCDWYMKEIVRAEGCSKRWFQIKELPYRQAISQSGFDRIGAWTNLRMFQFVPACEHMIELNRIAYFKENHGFVVAEPEIIECKDLYHFYDMIGFDRKTRKYNTGETIIDTDKWYKEQCKQNDIFKSK